MYVCDDCTCANMMEIETMTYSKTKQLKAVQNNEKKREYNTHGDNN